jgi:cholesterol oxidase
VARTVPAQDCFDAIVIGSGFGGAIAAHRLAQLGVGSVLVLERGMPYPPGSFAQTPSAWAGNVWAPGARPQKYGMFEILRLGKVTAVVASGLGGGSLIYANVLLRKPAHTFGADESNRGKEWPVTPAELEPHYVEILAVIDPQTVPPHYDIPKREAFERAVRDRGLTPHPAPLAVRFGDGHHPPAPGQPLLDRAGNVDRGNLHGRPRRTCTLVGACDFGCNDGAKDSLDFTFLSAFANAPGGRREIRTCCEAVRVIGLPRGGYDVRYVQHGGARDQVLRRAAQDGVGDDTKLLDRLQSTERVVRAKVVVVSAGTFGSTKLLLKSQLSLPRLSRALGRGFSSNGDLLRFARDCRERPNGPWRGLAPSRGPVITTYAQHAVDGREMWLEDGGYPPGMQMLWQLTAAPEALWNLGRLALERVSGRLKGNVGDRYLSAMGPVRYSGAMLPLLAMGRDVPGGEIALAGKSLTLNWDPDGASNIYFSAVERQLEGLTQALGGIDPANGLGRFLYPGRGLTAHALGGCAMARDPADGVVDPCGEVFGSKGLFVADGSVMPGPIGPNPSLTIAAMARRIATCACDRTL